MIFLQVMNELDLDNGFVHQFQDRNFTTGFWEGFLIFPGNNF